MGQKTHLDVIIVDEDELHLRQLCRTISTAGYRVHGARDALAVCPLVAFQQPCLAVIDLDISLDVSGKDALWLAHRFTSVNPCLQVLFTAWEPEKLARAKQSSVPSLGLLLKPLDHSDILPIVTAVTMRQPHGVHLSAEPQRCVKVA